ncbi:MAG: hypothetical protein Tsb009_19120 [Planctomycetaceae bacterium]
MRLLLALLVGVFCSLGFLWFTEIPLGIPGEWTWKRIGDNDAAGLVETMLGLIGGLVAGAVYVGFCWLGVRRIGNAGRGEQSAWLAGFTLVAMLFLFTGQLATREDLANLKWAWVLFDPSASGYFHDSLTSDLDTRAFLADFERKMSEGDVFHIGTHPPGLFLMNRALLAGCRESELLRDYALMTQPDSVREAFDIIEYRVHVLQKNERPRIITQAERAALWLSVLLTHFFAAATVVPLFLLIKSDFETQAAWKAAAFWPLVPALLVFLPKSDALLPFWGMSFLACWQVAVKRRSYVLAGIGGLIFWVGMNLSLAIVPVGFLAVLLTVWNTLVVPNLDVSLGRRVRESALLAATALAIFLMATWFLYWEYDLNLFHVWAWNVSNHAGFYERSGFSRTWWKWLLVNPLELMLAIGWPLFLLGIVRLVNRKKREQGESSNDGTFDWRARETGIVFCCLATWGLLWLSGKNMGEAARLWLFLMPWWCWMSGWFWSPEQTIDKSKSPLQIRFWLGVLTLQLVVCLFTISRVSGFHFGG